MHYCSDATLPTSRPLANEVSRAITRALMPGGSDADLRALVSTYTRELRDEGFPPEQALVRVKRLIIGATTSGLHGAVGFIRADAISRAVGSWFVAAYYRAD